ncbi:hypothetical protein LTR28_008974, partial [Elasticomyces elasticus]
RERHQPLSRERHQPLRRERDQALRRARDQSTDDIEEQVVDGSDGEKATLRKPGGRKVKRPTAMLSPTLEQLAGGKASPKIELRVLIKYCDRLRDDWWRKANDGRTDCLRDRASREGSGVV